MCLLKMNLFFQISELNHVGLKIVRTEPFYLSESDCLFLLHNLQSLLYCYGLQIIVFFEKMSLAQYAIDTRL